jgi:hypothetical protein
MLMGSPPCFTSQSRKSGVANARAKKLQQGWDQIRAADAMSDETMRRNTQFLDSIGRQEVAMRSNGESSGGSGGGGDGFLRDEGHDRFSDLMRSADIF